MEQLLVICWRLLCILVICERVTSIMDSTEFYATKGQGYDEFTTTEQLVALIKGLNADERDSNGIEQSNDVLTLNMTDLLFDDILYVPEQLKAIYHPYVSSITLNTRKVIDDTLAAWSKWPSATVLYELDPLLPFTSTQEQRLLLAMEHMENHTCIKFTRGNSTTEPYLLLGRNNSETCWSYLGNVFSAGPQPANLASGCFASLPGEVGLVLHVLSHALGLVHEQTRPDRSDHITVDIDEVEDGQEANFEIITGVDADIQNAVPYDLSSIMQDQPWAFSDTGQQTMAPVDSLFLGNMNQRFQLSFYDAKAINMAYCSASCSSPLNCLHGGYTDPTDCTRCRCIEGYTGTTCNQTDPGSSATDSGCPDAGSLFIPPLSTKQCFEATSDGSDTFKCNWLLNTKPGLTIDLSLEKTTLRCTQGVCSDYVEVRYMDLLVRGPRFCCNTPPIELDETKGNFITSDSHEILVNFGGHGTNPFNGDIPSFKMCYALSPLCSIGEDGSFESYNMVTSGSLPSGKKNDVAIFKDISDPCRAKVMVRTDYKGDIAWASVAVGEHNGSKYKVNYAFHWQEKDGVYLRGKQMPDPIKLTFPYAGWSDDEIEVQVQQVNSGFYQLEAFCKTGSVKKSILKFTDGKKADRDITIRFGNVDDWSGSCFP